MNHITEQLCWAAGLIISLLLTPLLPGIINKTKAFFAGRKGPRLLQMYYDIAKLLKRGSIRSTTSGGLVRMAPVLNLAVLLAALIFIPFANSISPFAFTGDVMLFLYLPDSAGSSRSSVHWIRGRLLKGWAQAGRSSSPHWQKPQR